MVSSTAPHCSGVNIALLSLLVVASPHYSAGKRLCVGINAVNVFPHPVAKTLHRGPADTLDLVQPAALSVGTGGERGNAACGYAYRESHAGEAILLDDSVHPMTEVRSVKARILPVMVVASVALLALTKLSVAHAPGTLIQPATG